MPTPSSMQTVTEIIDHHGSNSSDKPFLIIPESNTMLSYGELAGIAKQTAQQLYTLGIKEGASVGLMLDNGYWSTTLFLASMYGGFVTLPLNAVAGPSQLAYVVEHSDVGVVFVNAKYHGKLRQAAADLDRPIRLIPTDEASGPEWPIVAERRGSGPVLPTVTATTDALMLYTSGTTGTPKGAVLAHRSMVAGGSNTALAHELSALDRALCVLPLYHINGQIVTVMAPLVSGGSVVMPRRYQTGEFWKMVADYRCTWFSVVPTIIKYLLDRAAEEPYQFGDDPCLQQLRFGRSASAPLPASVHREFESIFNIPMIETMGLTETAAPILSNPMPPGERKSGSPGIAIGNEVKVVDDQCRDVATETVGELVVKGENVLTRYYKNEDASASAFTTDGWFRTGDLGYCDSDGYFFITGRLKELIIKGGENIAPREVDDVLYQHPAVLEAAAVGVPDDVYGQDIVACVCLRNGFQCSVDELLTLCEEQLGAFKSPSQIYFLDGLPKGPSGKIQRLQLPELLRHKT